jgi:hypothetical protein
MKNIIIAASLLTISAGAASAQGWHSGHGYERRHHAFCQEKAQNLHQYERRSARDGIITPNERRTMRALEADLAKTCGGYRWRG